MIEFREIPAACRPATNKQPRTTADNEIVVESKSVYEYFYRSSRDESRWRSNRNDFRGKKADGKAADETMWCNKAPNLSITRKTLCIVRASSFSSRANSPRVHIVWTSHRASLSSIPAINGFSHSAPIISNIYFQFRVYQSRHNRLILISRRWWVSSTLWHAYLPTNSSPYDFWDPGRRCRWDRFMFIIIAPLNRRSSRLSPTNSMRRRKG